jgi:NitT/TauT family transport system substrate-binding protein
VRAVGTRRLRKLHEGGISVRSHFRKFAGAVAISTILLAGMRPVSAETAHVRFARQFSMGYLQFNVMEHAKLVEKHAKALGLGDVDVSWVTFNGPNNMNDALLSGSVDVVAGGVPGLLTLWARTQGTAQEVRGIAAMSSQPFLLNTRNAAVRALGDFTPQDRIALPAVKVSVQAVVLEMAAAKLYGAGDYARLDPLTVSMSPPDATIALLSASGDVTAVFSVPPYQAQQLEQPGIHTVLNSFDVMGGPHTFTVAWTSAAFHDGNPKLYAAVFSAMKEATDIVNKDKRAAAALWIDDVKSKLPLDFAAKVVSGPQVKWTLAPQNTMKFAAFMHAVGAIKIAPASWKDFFFPELHGAAGS